MKCRQCGTEIADKALICYRCGTATTEARFKLPAAAAGKSRGRATLIASVLALVLLVIFALYMGRAATGETPQLVSWIAVAIAVVIVALRAYGRRR